MLLAWFHLHLHFFQHVEPWIENGGYFVLFALLFSCGLGLPLPEDVPLIAAGVLISQQHMHWLIAAPVAWCGIIGGDCMLYMLGRNYGRGIVKVPYIGKHLTLSRIDKAERYFDRYGVWVVGIGRMFAIIRGAMVVAAGVSRLKFIKFVVADGLAAIVSGGMFMLIGFWCGNNKEKLKATVHEFKHCLLIAIAILIVVLIVYFYEQARRRRAAAAARGFEPIIPESPKDP